MFDLEENSVSGSHLQAVIAFRYAAASEPRRICVWVGRRLLPSMTLTGLGTLPFISRECRNAGNFETSAMVFESCYE